MAKEERSSVTTAKLVLTFACVILLLFSLPATLTGQTTAEIPSNATITDEPVENVTQTTPLVTISGEPLISSEKGIARSFNIPLLEFDGEVAKIEVTIEWNNDGTTKVSDSRGYSYSIGIPPSQGLFSLWYNSTVIDQRVIGIDVQYDIYWQPVLGEDGSITNYKYTIAGTTLNGSSITFNIDGGKYDHVEDHRFMVMQPASARDSGLAVLDPTLNWTAPSDPAGIVRILPSDIKSSEDMLGLDWSDAVNAGYEIIYDPSVSTITIPVEKQFIIDPVTVATTTVRLSPAYVDWSSDPKRLVNIDNVLFAFYYDGSNIVYKTSQDHGLTWTGPATVGTGTLASYRMSWSIATTTISGTNYIAVMYWIPAGTNMEFYSQRGTVSGSTITWSGPRLLGYTFANSADCGSGSACGQVAGATDTNGYIYAAFSWKSGGASTFSYRILRTTDGGYTWSFLFSQVDGVSTQPPATTMARLASGKMLFAYGLYGSTEISYRILDGSSSWTDPPLSTSGAGMTLNQYKQFSSASDKSNKAFIAYNTGTCGTLKVARFSNSGSFEAFETADSTLGHCIPTITITADNAKHIFSKVFEFAGTRIFDTRSIDDLWQTPIQPFGTAEGDPDAITSGISNKNTFYAYVFWEDFDPNPELLRFDKLLSGHNFAGAGSFGDFNGDGRDDLAIGVPGEGIEATISPEAGVVQIIYGSSSGLQTSSPDDQVWTQDNSTIGDEADPLDNFGSALAAGDFNGDGRDDLAIGVPGESYGVISFAGGVNVLYGSSSGLTATGNQFWTQGFDGILNSIREGDMFGSALAAGDFNGDGRDDLAIGVPGEDINFAGDEGAVHVLYGSSSGLTATGNQFWHQDNSTIVDSAEQSDIFGSALAAGDFNGDGRDDLAIGAFQEDIGTGTCAQTSMHCSAGAINVLFGSSSGLTATGNLFLYQDNVNVRDAAEDGDNFGHSLDTGDFNGDGKADLAIGVPLEDGLLGDDNIGAVNVLYGSSSGFVALGQWWSQGSTDVEDSPEDNDNFGWSVAAGDFNGDGKADLAIGVPLEDTTQENDGAINVLYGSSSGLTATGNQFWRQGNGGVDDTGEAGDNFGAALSVGKFNSDTRVDLAIGVPGENIGTITFAGAVHVLYGGTSGIQTSSPADQFWRQGNGGLNGKVEAEDKFGRALA